MRANITCEAERIGLKVRNTIFLLAGVADKICPKCDFKSSCSFKIRDYDKKTYKEFVAHQSSPSQR